MNTTVSIIVPTYNEEKDIGPVLDTLVKMTYADKEIIVVDDKSLDRTVEIVEMYAKKYPFLTLIKKPKNEGVSLTRNVGIRKAKGDIIIILNADVTLPPTFIQQILRHYKKGADFVLVEAEAINQNRFLGRWLEAIHHNLYDNQAWISWTEGFSCKKSAAISVGLFPYVGRNAAGEDAVFAQNLEKRGYRKVIDKSIVVKHYVPDTLPEFWSQRRGRGKGTVYLNYHIYKHSSLRLLGSILFKHTPYTLLYALVPVIPLVSSFSLCKYSKKGWEDFVPFILASVIDRLAKYVGLWHAWNVVRKE